MNRAPRIIHLIDSLAAGGAERIALNHFNMLNEAGITTYLCATRLEGLLLAHIKFIDRYFFLKKERTIDVKAIFRLLKFITKNNITVVHAHSSSFFLGVIIKLFKPGLKLIWHDHFGLREFHDQRPSWVLKMSSLFFNQVIVVNSFLKAWNSKNLWIKEQQVHFLANHADFSNKAVLPWTRDRLKLLTIIYVANFRPEKNHNLLLDSFTDFKTHFPQAKLILIGQLPDSEYASNVMNRINAIPNSDIFVFNKESDIVPFLNNSSIAVLSSNGEGLPVSLLEYGLAGLPVVSTAVGECPTVLGFGKYGVLIKVGDRKGLTDALINLVNNPDVAFRFSKDFKDHVDSNYSGGAVINHLLRIYERV